MKKILSIFLAIVCLLLSVKTIAAATLTLDSIGEDSVADTVFTSWTYETANPIFTGTAAAGASVSIKIDDLINTVAAATDGEWTFIPTTLLDGTYSILITSGVESMSFDLTIGSATSSTTTTTSTTTSTASATTSTSSASTTGVGMGGASESTTLPQTGSVEQTFLILSVGMLLTGFGLMIKARYNS